MITQQSLTIGGQTESVFVFTQQPNMESPFRLEHLLKTEIVRSLTDRETRYPCWECIRSKVEYRYDLQTDDAAEVRTLLATIEGSRIMVPFWHDIRLQSDWANRIYEPQFILDVEAAWVYPMTSIGSISAGHHVVPLILCRMARPSIGARTEGFGEFPITFTEDSPWDCRCGVRDLSLTDGTFPTLDPDWTRNVDRSKDRMELIEVGQARERAAYLAQSPMRWGQEAQFTMEMGSLHTLLSFFANNSLGRYRKFTVPQYFKPHDQASPETPDGYVARFARDVLSIDLYGARMAIAQVGVWGLPWELNPPAGEVFEAPQQHWLYEFKWIIPDGTVIYSRFTSSERDIAATIDGQSQTFTAAHITHDGPENTLNGKMGKVSIEFADQTGNPLIPWYRREGEGRLILNLYLGEGSSPTGTMEFSGELGEVGLSKNLYTADFGEPKRRKTPRVLMQRKDNHGFFDGGFSTTTYQKIGTIVSLDSTTIYVDLTSGSVSGKELAGGMIRIGSGETYEARTILDHGDAGATSDLYLYLDRPLVHAGISDQIVMFPFYSRTYAAAKSFPANYAAQNFLGFPSLPVTDPSVENGTPEAAYQGKK